MKVLNEKSDTYRTEEIEVSDLEDATKAAFIIAEAYGATENESLRIEITPGNITKMFGGDIIDMGWTVRVDWEEHK